MKFTKGIAVSGMLLLAVGVAAAKDESRDIKLYESSVVAGKELKPGDYQVKWSGDKASIQGAKESVEAPVKVESGESKYPRTLVRYNVVDGKYRVQEILLGGTKTKLVFDSNATGGGGQPAGVR